MFNLFKTSNVKKQIVTNKVAIDHLNKLLTTSMALGNQIINMTEKDINCPLFMGEHEAKYHLFGRLMLFSKEVNSFFIHDKNVNYSFHYPSFTYYTVDEKVNTIRGYHEDKLSIITERIQSKMNEYITVNKKLERSISPLTKDQARKILTSK